MNQVHKESLSSVENALPNRQGLDVEIFGMEGIPDDIVQQHNQRIIQNFYQAQAERYAATGNPPPGQGRKGPAKKIKIETADEIKKRLAEHRARLATQKTMGGGSAGHTPREGLPDRNSPAQSASPGAFVRTILLYYAAFVVLLSISWITHANSIKQNSPFPPPSGQYPGFPPQSVPGFSPPPQYPGAYPPPSLPSRPGSNLPVPAGLPPRPGQAGWQGNASTIDELVSGAAQQGDDIDQIIRMAEAGIKPPKKPETPTTAEAGEATEKKSKKDKDKNVKMVYDDEISPEERMAMMPRYAFVPEAAA